MYGGRRGNEHGLLSRLPDTILPAPHNDEQIAGRIAVDEARRSQRPILKRGARPVEAKASDRGFAATSNLDNRARVSVGAGVMLRFVEMIDL
jgi:hypothetical protein